MKKFRVRSPRNVIKEIKELEKMGFNGILIIDDNFNALPERSLKITELIRKEKIKMDFGFQARAYPNDRFWNKLSKTGFNQCFIGIEHIKPEIVKFFNKYHNPSEWSDIVKKTLSIMQKNNICVGGSIILGAPMEERQDAEDLIDFCYESGVDVITSNKLEYVYGSDLWFDAVNKKLFDKSALHVQGSKVHPKEYLDEMCEYAWKLSLRNINRILFKIIKNKRDKLTPILSAIRWSMTNPKEFFSDAYDAYGYGKRREVKKDDNLN